MYDIFSYIHIYTYVYTPGLKCHQPPTKKMRHQDPLKNLTGFSDFKNVTMAIMAIVAIMAKSKVTSHAGQVAPRWGPLRHSSQSV